MKRKKFKISYAVLQHRKKTCIIFITKKGGREGGVGLEGGRKGFTPPKK